jgi:DNA repair protein RadC
MATARRRTKRSIRDEYTPPSRTPSRAGAPDRGLVAPKRVGEGGSISYHEGSGAMARLAAVDRPREKLARAGVEALGDNELLALVLGTGTRFRGALSVAQDILDAARGVQGLGRLGLDELYRVRGVAESRAARVLAAVELGRRTMTPAAQDYARILTAKDAAAYLLPRYSGFRVERVGVMLLDSKHRMIRTMILSTGSIETSLAHPRDVYRAAALASASSVVVFHNHPSGDPTPSMDDYAVTDRLAEAGRVMGIDLADHIILGEGDKYFSFSEEVQP